jgi:hypothetical protein
VDIAYLLSHPWLDAKKHLKWRGSSGPISPVPSIAPMSTRWFAVRSRDRDWSAGQLAGENGSRCLNSDDVD